MGARMWAYLQGIILDVRAFREVQGRAVKAAKRTRAETIFRMVSRTLGHMQKG